MMKNPATKHMLCNSEKEPLLFESQLIAVQFWKNHEDKFDTPVNAVRIRATPQVVRDSEFPDDILFAMIENGE
jgi:hypothetical protein